MGNNHASRLSTAGYSLSKSSSGRSKGKASSNASSKEAPHGSYTDSERESGLKSPSMKRFMLWHREVKGRRANSMNTVDGSDYVTLSDQGSSIEAHSMTSERGFLRSENAVWIDGRERLMLDMNGHISTIPMDSEETEQTKTNHYIYKYVLRGNHTATLTNPKRILEVCAKTGVWTKEMAKEFPKAKLTAVDMQNEIDKDNWPSNAEFVLGDILSPNGLPFKSETFDYIQMRHMRFFIPDETWPKVMAELYRVCKPGGQIELLEVDFDFQARTPETKQFRSAFSSILRTSGVEVEAICHLDLLMELSGLAEIKKQQINIPAGEWGEAIGHIVSRTAQHYFRTFRATVAQYDIMHLDEYDDLLDYCFEHLDELRGFATLHVNVGRKPLGKNGRSGTLTMVQSPCRPTP
ncbi:S-adenosyl-L-methionine-dependent methyltransferase [Syncephalis pseudoplumigaleata]|uniref:S-adenosyl-L-methionine-dependent methyltransferase n=1 Tax=Syncephalis pseudoplumigaleata TaxID=1712513 RepID=A0A4P9YUD8_9FUNG|nr:S-adenosyl-L-methionine-dependent methyltransferase [Syncephalis pseudoplumigaleata]|eukprot:RKP23444.1 S-adenosyl-L-methionine-dependent methyltransferase [Syncephalis pseudoplumigaleata]